MGQVLEDWISSTHRAVELGQLRSTTAQRYEYVARTVIETIGTKRAETLTTPDVEKMLLTLTVRKNSSPDLAITGRKPASDAYRRDARFVLSQALEAAVQAGSKTEQSPATLDIPDALYDARQRHRKALTAVFA